MTPRTNCYDRLSKDEEYCQIKCLEKYNTFFQTPEMLCGHPHAPIRGIIDAL